VKSLVYRVGLHISKTYLRVKVFHGIKGTPGERQRASHLIANTPTKVYEAGVHGVNSPGDLVESLDYDLISIACFGYCLGNLSSSSSIPYKLDWAYYLIRGLNQYNPSLLSVLMSYYIDPCSNVRQYPILSVREYHSSTVARQVGALGAYGYASMTSGLPDNSLITSANQGVSTSTPLVWTQVGSIVFPVYIVTTISTGPIVIGSEKGTATTERNDAPPIIPPTPVENGTSTAPTPGRYPQAAEFHSPCERSKPTRTTTLRPRTWCPVHKTTKHALEDCPVIFHVQAELYACWERGIQCTSPTSTTYFPIHRSKVYDLTNCRIFLRTLKPAHHRVQQPRVQTPCVAKEPVAAPDRFVGFIGANEPSVLHLLEGYESSLQSPREVNVVDNTETSMFVAARTLAHQLRNVDAILRESPLYLVTNPDASRWAK
jgi:hypothetical protein